MSQRLPQGRRMEYLSQYGYTVGSDVVVERNDEEECGAVRYIGNTRFAPGIWVGVELVSKTGKNDGSVDEHRYFRCDYPHGVFVRPEKVFAYGVEMETRFEANVTLAPSEAASPIPNVDVVHEPDHESSVSSSLPPTPSAYDESLAQSTPNLSATGSILNSVPGLPLSVTPRSPSRQKRVCPSFTPLNVRRLFDYTDDENMIAEEMKTEGEKEENPQEEQDSDENKHEPCEDLNRSFGGLRPSSSLTTPLSTRLQETMPETWKGSLRKTNSQFLKRLEDAANESAEECD